MFKIIRKHLRYSNIMMTLALVFAMSGGAYAASKYLITSTKQISPKVLKALRGTNGKNGAPGATGPQGPQGPVGPAGKDGANGVNGKDGINGAAGTNGTAGVSVTSKVIATKEAACGGEGGSEFTAAENKKTTACNGSPWTAKGTLPVGSTETGDWEVRSTASAAGEFKVTTISFAIPLTSNPSKTVFVKVGEATPGECKGSVAAPGAQSGVLCLFEGEGFSVIHKGGLEYAASVNPTGGPEAATTGAQPVFTTMQPKVAGEEVSAEGTWAVTG